MTHKKKRKLNKAQTALFMEHKVMAERIARGHSKWKSTNRADKEDLVNSAYVALVEATLEWDPQRGPFKPYAIQKIKWALQVSDYKHTFAVHVPLGIQSLIRDIRKAIDAGATTIMEVSQATKINPSKVRQLWDYRNTGFSHFDPAVHDVASMDVPTEDLIDEKDEKAKVRFAISQLPIEQRAIVRARFGFTTGQPMTTDEIADYLGLFIDDVRAVEEEAMEHLKAILSDW